MRIPYVVYAAVLSMICAGWWTPAWSQTVKLTTLGSHTGEMCGRDRAMLFEDPNGTTILFDAGRTVAGPDDPRLPEKLDVVLVSSVHGDHQGDRRIANVGEGSCKSPKTEVKTVPNSNSVEIAAKKGAFILGAGQMGAYLRTRMVAAGTTTDQARKLARRLRPGGKMNFNGVKVAAIPTVHANGASPSFVLDEDLKQALAKSGLTVYVGPDSGFVLTFTNGLVVYLSADTGHTSDMDTLVRRYYKAKLAIVNMGDINTMGPEEAAWAINELIKPNTAMPTHANEASTQGGKPIPGSKVATFIAAVDKRIPVHLPLSGKTLEFDSNAKCVKGC
jgi:L-ascorbate metabolism protein UlaG (beta-lactamase superfamily)